MKKVLLIHGPNLNLTGMREPGIYGTDTLASINADVVQKCERLGMDCSVFQSNSEGALIDRIHAAREDCDAIIMNAGAYTHGGAYCGDQGHGGRRRRAHHDRERQTAVRNWLKSFAIFC